MRRFFVPADQIRDDRALITGADAHHLRRVLRLRVEDPVVIFDGSGAEYQATIAAIEERGVSVANLKRLGRTPESPLDFTLAQGFLKESKMDDLVRHLTELGVTSWIPVMAGRSVPAPNAQRLSARRERWRKISMEALKQCGRSRPMAIEAAVPFSRALELAAPYDLKLIFHFQEEAGRPPTAAGEPLPRRAFVMVGPEGGFEPTEIEAARAAGFLVAGMGPRVLRAETAALSAAVLVQFLFGDLGNSL